MENIILDGKVTSKNIIEELKAKFDANPTDKRLAIVSRQSRHRRYLMRKRRLRDNTHCRQTQVRQFHQQTKMDYRI